MRVGTRKLLGRRVLQSAMAVGLVAGVTSANAPAHAAPERVLQNVAVSLGTDSSITEITSTAVRAGEEGDLTSDTQDLTPGDVARDLPVRILTSYRLGDKAGTDLKEIEGESGRVLIDVTVQNITASPRELAFDFNGAPQKQYAMVATPMTVVASATLGKGEFGSIVTADDVHPDQVTNGVVGKAGGKKVTDTEGADVQWAALLAPPRLGASATFTLAMDTEDFQVPTFDFSIQPGLVTDSSVQRLLEAAFAEDPSSTLALETQTIELVGNVNTILTGASSVLAQIQGELGTSANTLGAQTISNLQASSQQVTTSLTGLAQDLKSLDQSVESELNSANQETVSQFNETVSQMQALLGDPSKFGKVPDLGDFTCESKLPKIKNATSITEQMIGVTAHLNAISEASRDCKADVIEGLRTAIGDKALTAADCANAQYSASVMCSLIRTQSGLAASATQLAAAKEEFKQNVKAGVLGDLGTSLEDVRAKVLAVRVAADGVYGNVGTPDGTQAIRDAQAAMVELQASLTTVEGAMTSVNTKAVEAKNSLAEAALATVPDQLAAVAADVCMFYNVVNPVEAARKDSQSVALTGLDCAGEPPAVPLGEDVSTQVTNAEAKVAEALSALDIIAAASDPGRGDTAQAFASLDRQVGIINSKLTRLSAMATNNNTSVRELMAAVNALVPGIPEQWYCPGAAPVEGQEELPPPGELTPETLANPMELLWYRYKAVDCNRGQLDAQIDNLFATGIDSLTTSAAEMDSHKAVVDAARVAAETKVTASFKNVEDLLASANSSIMTQGEKTVRAQRSELEAAGQQMSSQLEQRIAQAIGNISSNVSSSVTDLNSSQTQLVASLNGVLTNLGDRNVSGAGLLGSLTKGAADTGTATTQVVDATRTASEFSSVRSEALRDVYLQQAQLARSLELQETYPVFGIELPDGSSHLTVFTYHLEG